MKDAITKESATGRKLIFFPQSKEECRQLQERLFELGFIWADGCRGIQNVSACVQNGLVLMNDRIFFRSPGDTQAFTPCSIEQVLPSYMPPDQRMMLDLFNRLSAKVDALAEKVDRIHNELVPDIDETKPGLGKRSARAPRRGG